MFFIDSHTHISMTDFDDDREQVLQNAMDQEVKAIMEVGYAPDIAKRALQLGETYDNIYCAIGLHPHDADKYGEDWFEEIEEIAKNHPKVLAIGETGLDFYRDWSPRDDQIRAFRRQIALARSVNKPLVIHCRDAHAETLQILEEERAQEVGGVMHCFSGNADVAQKSMDLNFVLGIGGTITYKKSIQREFIADIPLDHLILETDCPFLSPVPFRGKRNEPARVRIIAEELSKLMTKPLPQIAEMTTRTFEKTFKVKLKSRSV